ncbi:hypothetical protein MCHI_003090 [Candidatus Magnetoovum chiemensis]|nr:hypothetical protein MCHI_003090 [Candidatus Magnetoovum chiemensis]
MQETIERVDKLEFLMAQLIEERRESVKELRESQRESRKEADRQMEELRESQRKSQEKADRQMEELRESQKETAQQLRKSITSLEKDFKRVNQDWGNLSRKLGTIVEDMVFPSIARIIRERFGYKVTGIFTRVIKTLDDGREKEFDLYADTKDYIFLNSTKATLTYSDVRHFSKDISKFRLFCSEYNHKPLIGILSTLNIKESVLRHAQEAGYIVLGIGFELMEVKNTAGFEPKLWHYRPQ